jgi:hypothetical protein
MTISREVTEGTQLQGTRESIAYKITTTPWGSDPSGVTVKAFDVTKGDRTDVSSTKLVGSPSVDEDVITLPALSGLTVGNLYRLEVNFVSGGNTWEAYFYVLGEE